MDVRFAKPTLGLIETARAAKTGLPFSVIAVARSRLNILRAAPDAETLIKWKSLRYERIEGSSRVNGRVALDDAWRLDLCLSTTQSPNVMTVLDAIKSVRGGDHEPT